jgi:hypothetical protein
VALEQITRWYREENRPSGAKQAAEKLWILGPREKYVPRGLKAALI